MSKYSVFVKVISLSSLSKTAEELGYSQSAVSQAVLSLEKELGTTLIKRDRSGISLTRDGREYYPYIESVAAAEARLANKQKEMAGFENQTIRIGAFTSITRNVLPSLMQSFKKKYPGVSFLLRQGDYDDIAQWIHKGEVDFGFISDEKGEGLKHEVLFTDTMKAVLPKGHPLSRKKVVSLADLCNDDFILLDEGEYSTPLRAFAKAGLVPKTAYKIYDDYSILAMIQQGMGISILYTLVVQGYEDKVVLKPIREGIERRIALVYEAEGTMPASSREFMDLIRNKMKAGNR